RLSEFSGNVVVLDEDWRMHALSLAASLPPAVESITLVTRQEFVGKGLDLPSQAAFHARLADRKVTSHPWSTVEPNSANGLDVRNVLTGSTPAIGPVSAVIAAANMVPAKPSEEAFGRDGPQWIAVGDCVFPRGIEVAIHEAHVSTREFL